MKAYTQKTYRVEAKKAEQIDSIRKERGLSWNGIVDAAFDMLLDKVQKEVPSISDTGTVLDLIKEKNPLPGEVTTNNTVIVAEQNDDIGIPPGERLYTSDDIEEAPNKDITAPEYDKVTEGYNPDDKTIGGKHGGGFNLSVGEEDV